MYNSGIHNNTHSPITREEWLEKAIAILAPYFASHDASIPAVRVSVGWPVGSREKVIGQHWHPKASADGVSQIFISPLLDDGLKALDTLVHELVHAVYPSDGHGKLFKRLARAIGLEGKLTATVAGPRLMATLKDVERSLGAYPHAKLNPALSGKKKQGTRLIKCECSECGYTVRVTQKWLSQGAPLCVCNSKPMQAENPEAEDALSAAVEFLQGKGAIQ